MQLGPGLCLARVPRNGRNFEYLSGEDPYLGYTLVQPAVKGIQSQGVIANAKHWVLNNQVRMRAGRSKPGVPTVAAAADRTLACPHLAGDQPWRRV